MNSKNNLTASALALILSGIAACSNGDKRENLSPADSLPADLVEVNFVKTAVASVRKTFADAHYVKYANKIKDVSVDQLTRSQQEKFCEDTKFELQYKRFDDLHCLPAGRCQTTFGYRAKEQLVSACEVMADKAYFKDKICGQLGLEDYEDSKEYCAPKPVEQASEIESD